MRNGGAAFSTFDLVLGMAGGIPAGARGRISLGQGALIYEDYRRSMRCPIGAFCVSEVKKHNAPGMWACATFDVTCGTAGLYIGRRANEDVVVNLSQIRGGF